MTMVTHYEQWYITESQIIKYFTNDRHAGVTHNEDNDYFQIINGKIEFQIKNILKGGG